MFLCALILGIVLSKVQCSDQNRASDLVNKIQLQMDSMKEQMLEMDRRHHYEVAKLKKAMDVIETSCANSKHERSVKRANTSFAGNVAFDAYLSHAVASLNANDVIIYDTVLTNIGSAYDNQSGVFVAPVKGTYLFSWTTVAGYGASHISHLTQNGHHIATTEADSSLERKFVSTATKMTVLNLDAGDRIYVQISSSRGDVLSSNSLYGHSGISGTLLFQTE